MSNIPRPFHGHLPASEGLPPNHVYPVAKAHEAAKKLVEAARKYREHPEGEDDSEHHDPFVEALEEVYKWGLAYKSASDHYTDEPLKLFSKKLRKLQYLELVDTDDLGE